MRVQMVENNNQKFQLNKFTTGKFITKIQIVSLGDYTEPNQADIIHTYIYFYFDMWATLMFTSQIKQNFPVGK